MLCLTMLTRTKLKKKHIYAGYRKNESRFEALYTYRG